MRILLLNRASREQVDASRERYFIRAGSRWPWSYIRNKNHHKFDIFPFPFYIAYCAADLRRRGHEVFVHDGVALNSTDTDLMDIITHFSPDFICLEGTSHAYTDDMSFLSSLRNLRLKIVVTGPHATISAKEILNKNPFVDYVVKGEYELSIASLIDAIENESVLRLVPGIAYRDTLGNIFESDKNAYIEDIDELPRPAFEDFPETKKTNMAVYGDGINTYRPAVTLHSTRGCPFRCDFCLWIQVMYGNNKYRKFKIDRVVDEMEYVIHNFGAKEIYFDDDDFCIDKKNIQNLCNEIISRKLRIKWSCMGDAMSCDEDTIKIMAKAGCIFMKFGVESGSKEILKEIGKPLDPEKAVAVANWCRKYGIMTHATFMFGLSNDTKETMQLTLELAKRVKFDYAQASIATPFPGTRMHSKLSASTNIGASDSKDFDGTRISVVGNQNLSSEEIVKFRKYAIKQMVYSRLKEWGWWKNFLRWNFTLVRSYGIGHSLRPLYAFIHLHWKG